MAVKNVFTGKISLTGVLPLELVPRELSPGTYMSYAIVGLNAVGTGGEGFPS
ncbi:hypothetical protein [Pyrococcus kukulkanii]|uniref:hypothetical protein n=1 Tax=Pyrococcus kukulkanii TaxID=1609559 RepID=UPI0035622678